MIENLPDLIGALRDELQQFGELLAQLDQHQERVLHGTLDDLLLSVSSIHAQGAVLEETRGRRAARQRQVARGLALAENATLAELLPRLPEPYRPLVEALAQENTELLARVQERSRQNSVLLARMVRIMRRFMSTL